LDGFAMRVAEEDCLAFNTVGSAQTVDVGKPEVQLEFAGLAIVREGAHDKHEGVVG
jgi:hypothetical protein